MIPFLFAWAQMIAQRSFSSITFNRERSKAILNLRREVESRVVIMPPMPQDVFQQEQSHLTYVYAELKRLGTDCVKRMERTASQAQEDKRAMAEELSVNLANYADAMETYADFAAMNTIVEMSNLTQTMDAQRLADITLLLKQPYFAKVNLKFPQFEDVKEIYIGAAGISDENYQKLVVDWRSPIAETYYNQGTGPTSYEANGRTIHADLQLRRQFSITEDRLLQYFDTTVAIQDPLLLKSLESGKTDRMEAITTTIQKEQNTVIRHEDVPTLLVIGAAGSGKTSVMMQRIAYLFYQLRDSLAPENVALITPNAVFGAYIEDVLPELGEKNPPMMTWQGLMGQLLPEGRGIGDANVPVDRLDAIDVALEHFEFQPGDFRDIAWDGVRLVSASQILKISARHSNYPAGPRRVTMMREAILKRLNARLNQIASQDDTQDQLAALTLDEQIAQFGSPVELLTEEEAVTAARQFVHHRFEPAFAFVEEDAWIDVDHMGYRLLEREGLTSLEWLYLKMGLTGLAAEEVRYAMIDEVQDYTAAQLMVAARYFRYAHFLLLGDPNQAIAEGTASFDDIRTIFGQPRGNVNHGPVSECTLPTSYRCTPQITRLFASLAETDTGMSIQSVQRGGTDPVILAPSQEQYLPEMARVIQCAEQQPGITAVIVPWKQDAKRLAKQLAPLDVHPIVMDGKTPLPERGVIVIPLGLAKGLEFDEVVIANAPAGLDPEDPLTRRRLYTAISRATRRLTIFTQP